MIPLLELQCELLSYRKLDALAIWWTCSHIAHTQSLIWHSGGVILCWTRTTCKWTDKIIKQWQQRWKIAFQLITIVLRRFLIPSLFSTSLLSLTLQRRKHCELELEKEWWKRWKLLWRSGNTELDRRLPRSWWWTAGEAAAGGGEGGEGVLHNFHTA